MSFTYDLATDVGQIRLIIPDARQSDHVFSDEELTAFLAIEGSSVKKAAALALETIAADNVLVLKVIKLLDLQTDGSKVAAALMTRAAALRAQADDETGETSTTFDWAHMILTDFQHREDTLYEAG